MHSKEDNLMKNGQKGITLIEIMVTLAILGVIAAIAYPAYNGYVNTSKRSECQNELGAIDLAQSEFFLENNSYFGDGDLTIQDIETSSQGLYVSGYTVPGDVAASNANIANANCSYAIIAGATGDIATSYQITATGQNDLAGEGCIARKPTPCP